MTKGECLCIDRFWRDMKSFCERESPRKVGECLVQISDGLGTADELTGLCGKHEIFYEHIEPCLVEFDTRIKKEFPKDYKKMMDRFHKRMEFWEEVRALRGGPIT